MGVSPKWVKSKRRRKKKERLNDGDNNGQATHGALMAHASRLDQNIKSTAIVFVAKGSFLRRPFNKRGYFSLTTDACLINTDITYQT